MNDSNLVDVRVPDEIIDPLRKIINTSHVNLNNFSQEQNVTSIPNVSFVESLTPLFALIQKANKTQGQVVPMVSEVKQTQPIPKDTFSFEGVNSIFQLLQQANNRQARINETPITAKQEQPIQTGKFSVEGVNSILQLIEGINKMKIQNKPQERKPSLQQRTSIQPVVNLFGLFDTIPKETTQNKKGMFSGFSIDELRSMFDKVWNMNRKPHLRSVVDKLRGVPTGMNPETEESFSGGVDNYVEKLQEYGNDEQVIYMANEKSPLYVLPNVPEPDKYDLIGTFGPSVDVTQPISVPRTRTRVYRNRETGEIHNEQDYYFNDDRYDDIDRDDHRYDDIDRDDDSEDENINEQAEKNINNEDIDDSKEQSYYANPKLNPTLASDVAANNSLLGLLKDILQGDKVPSKNENDNDNKITNEDQKDDDDDDDDDEEIDIDYNMLTVAQLKELADERGLVTKRMRKAEIIDFLKEDDRRSKGEEEEEEEETERLQKEKERVRLEQEAKEAEAERIRLEQEAKEAEAERVKLEQEAQDAEAERVRLEQEAKKAEIAERVKLEQEAQDAEAERVRLEQQVQDAEAERVRLEQDIQKAEAELVRLEQEAQDAEAERIRIEQEALEVEENRVKANQTEEESREKEEVDDNQQDDAIINDRPGNQTSMNLYPMLISRFSRNTLDTLNDFNNQAIDGYNTEQELDVLNSGGNNDSTGEKQYENLQQVFNNFTNILLNNPTVLKLNSLSPDSFISVLKRKVKLLNNQAFNPTLLKEVLFIVPHTSLGKIYDSIEKDYQTLYDEYYKELTPGPTVPSKNEIYNEFDTLLVKLDNFNNSRGGSYTPSTIPIIERDTKIYKGIYNDKNITDNIYALHLNTFNEYVKKIEKHENIYETEIERMQIKYFFMKILEQYVLDVFGENEQRSLKAIINQLKDRNNQSDFYTELDKQMRENVSNNVLTYIKLRNDNHNENIPFYNHHRFNISLASENVGQKLMNTSMLLKYNDDKKSYYKNNSLIREDTPNYKPYLFGKFNAIFDAGVPNTKIASDMEPVLDQLKHGKPVFLITYGASGAGKTSTLIYLRYVDADGNLYTQPGVLVELCNKLGADGYDSANVTVNEYFQSNTKEDTHSSENKHTGMCHKNKNVFTCNRKEYNFKYTTKSNSFMLKEPKEITPNMHQYRTQQKKSTFKMSESSMAEVISYLVDTDRLVHATTNNPQSSRSHCVVYITLVNEEGKKANLFVADLAGVENTFECESGKTIMDFMNIANSQGFKTEDNALIPYYSLSGSVLSEKSGGEDSTKTSLHPVFNELPETDTLLYSKDNQAALAKLFDFNDIIKSINSIPKWKESFKEPGKKVNISMLKRMIHQLLGIKKDVTTSMEYYEYMLNMDNDALDDNHGKYYNEIIDYKTNSDKLEEDVQKIITFLQYDKNETNRKHNYGYLFESKNVKDVAIQPSPDTKKEDVVKMLNEDTNIIISKEEGQEAITEILYFNEGSKIIVEKRIMSQQTSGKKANYDRIVSNSRNINPYTLTEILRDLKKQEIKGEDKINIYDEILKMEKLRNPNKNKEERLISNDDYRDLYDLLYEILSVNMERIKYGKEVCKNRREEGYFINSSLKLIRDTVNKILIEKGKDVLLQAPDIISDCLKDYCPTLSNCFQLTPIKNEKTEYSIIFDDVYKYLRQSDTNYKKIDFYKEILVCVFCVLNISRKANDPPLVSYLDMNDLKKQYYSTNVSIDDIKTNVGDLINKIETYNSKVEDEHGLVDVIQTDLDKLKELNTNTTSNSDNQAKSKYKETLEKVMNQVDNSNAVSAMGTLIFTDKIAKLNTTDTVCQPRLDDTITKSYKPLYEIGKEEIRKEEIGKEQIGKEQIGKEVRPLILKNRQRNNKSKRGHVHGRPGKNRGTRRG